MKYYYYYVLMKIYLIKGAKKMKKFLKSFILGFVIGFTVVAWASATITNSQRVYNEYVEMENA